MVRTRGRDGRAALRGRRRRSFRRRPDCRATFPTRRHHDQLTARGIRPAAVARLIGLPFRDAEAEAGKLGLRISTSHMLLNRVDRQLDVLADDGTVTNILGLHS